MSAWKSTEEMVQQFKARQALEQLEFEQKNPLPVPVPTDPALTVSTKYWRFTNYDVDNSTHRWMQGRVFKTDAGKVFACHVSVATEKKLDKFWLENNGRLPQNFAVAGKRPDADFVVYVKTEEEQAKSKLLAILDAQKQALLSGKIGAVDQIKSIVDSMQQIKKPNPFEPKAGDMQTKKMSSFAKKKQEWLWLNRIPFRSLTTLAGDPDQGKSLVSLYVAACVTTGSPFYGETESNQPADVLLLSAEDDPETTLGPRLEAAGADLDRVHLIESVIVTSGAGQTFTDRAAQLDQDLHKIEAELDRNKNIRLIIVDPVSSFLGDASMVKEQDVRKVLGPLMKVCQARRIAVLLVAHFNKNTDTRSAMDRVGGAKALVGLGRAAWTCVREPKVEDDGTNKGVELADPERRLFLKLKGNLTPTSVGGLVYSIRTKQVQVEGESGPEMVDVPVIVWLEKTASTAQDVVIDQNHKGTMSSPKSDGAKQWLKRYLNEAGGAAWSSDIFKDGGQYGHTVKALQRALGSLVNYKVARTGSGHTQWLEPGAKELLPSDVPSMRRKRKNEVSMVGAAAD